jgi:hypothetical protein
LHWVRAHGAERCIEPAVLAERVGLASSLGMVYPAPGKVVLVPRSVSGEPLVLTGVEF